jgi:ADP-ribosylglycohydrolase
MEVRLTEKEYRNKVLGCWMGKNIGGTLGMPFEGTMDMLNLTFFDPVPKEPIGNDDLDLQLVWLHTLVEKGINIDEHDMQRAWLNHVKDPFPDEYNKCYSAWENGLAPPVCGWYNNVFINCMGAPIRSEVWAAVCPGVPGRAVEYAYNDGILDHAEEGIYGEIFLAALESAAFCESDINKLLDIASCYIPADSLIMWGVNCVRENHKKGTDWREVRGILVEKYDTIEMAFAPINLAFMVVGLLYGDDFGSTLCTAVNCGYDTDCTGATVGSILGIMHGADKIPQKWIEPVGMGIKYDLQLVNFDVYDNLNWLTDDTLKVGYKILESVGTRDYLVRLEGKDIIFDADLYKIPEKIELYEKECDVISLPFENGIAHIKYNGEPTIGYGDKKVLNVKIDLDEGYLIKDIPKITIPDGWAGKISGKGTHSTITVTVPDSGNALVDISNRIMLDFEISNCEKRSLDFVLLGKRVWLVSQTISIEAAEDFDKVYLEEEALELKVTDSGVKIMQLDDEKMAGLFNSTKNGILYAQMSVYFPQERILKVNADCNDAVALWFEGEKILAACKQTEIRPAAHRIATTKEQITVKKGWNRFFLKLRNNRDDYEGHFFLAKMPPSYMGFPDIRFDALERKR